MNAFTQIPSLIQPLKNQVLELQRHWPKNEEILGVLLIGSCSKGEATYRSDVDLLIISKIPKLTYEYVKTLRTSLEKDFIESGHSDLLQKPLEVQMTIVQESVFLTIEPAMQDALRHAIILRDETHTIASKLKRKIA